MTFCICGIFEQLESAGPEANDEKNQHQVFVERGPNKLCLVDAQKIVDRNFEIEGQVL